MRLVIAVCDGLILELRRDRVTNITDRDLESPVGVEYTNCSCVGVGQHTVDHTVGVISKEYPLPVVPLNLHRLQGSSGRVHCKHSKLLFGRAHSLRHSCIILCKPDVRCEV